MVEAGSITLGRASEAMHVATEGFDDRSAEHALGWALAEGGGLGSFWSGFLFPEFLAKFVFLFLGQIGLNDLKLLSL